jgi:hypothetical protein
MTPGGGRRQVVGTSGSIVAAADITARSEVMDTAISGQMD